MMFGEWLLSFHELVFSQLENIFKITILFAALLVIFNLYPKLTKSHSECKICGKRGYLMDSKNNVYCKRHRNLEVKPTNTTESDAQ